MKTVTVTVLALVCFWHPFANAQSPTVQRVAKALGFTDAEIAKIKGGEIIQKDLKEGSDKELAGVVAVCFKKPVAELAGIALEGKMLESDATIRSFHNWKPDDPADAAFAKVELDSNESGETELYRKAAAGSKLNLSDAEIAELRKAGDVNATIRGQLKARYEAYRKSGLKGIAPYARGGKKTASPAEELTLAIQETMPAAPKPDYFQALLDYPAKPLAEVEHRFYWFKQEVEGRPTFILAHRARRQTDTAALLTEEQYYVGHSYNSNFIAGGCLAVEGGTLVFYVNRTFTDQVAGMGSGLKHGIGHKQMLSEVAANLKRVREQLQK